MSPIISVVLCTHNRAELLADALDSVLAQDFPAADYEIVVVDNGSTDGTRQLLGQIRRPQIRYLREESVGLCIARNTGWNAATGQYVVFFDDDANAEPGWLTAIANAFERSPNTIGMIGGRVRPVWDMPRPEWLSDAVAHSLTIVDWGRSDKVITDVRRQWLVGANLAVPKKVLREVGGFHPWLDRVGNNLLSNGDLLLQKEVMKRSYECLYVPAMAVSHRVPASRMNRRWFERRFFWQGVSDAVMYIIENMPAPRARLGLAMSTGRNVLRSRSALESLLFRIEQRDAFTSRCLALIELGFFAGLLGKAGR